MICQYEVSFDHHQHRVIQVDDSFEAFYYDQSIGIYNNLDDAANAVRWTALLVEWKPNVTQLLCKN